MKKYSNKKKLNSLPSFESEINNFVAKFDIFSAAQKKELKQILQLHFKNIASFDVDMWQLKQRLDESMQRVIVEFKHAKDMQDAGGYYDSVSNGIQIRKINGNNSNYFAVVVHELTHCLSSSREKFKNRPNHSSGIVNTGFLSFLHDTVGDQSEFFDCISNSRVLTEATTEFLTLSTLSQYYGSVVPNAYIQEQKILNQLKSILGSQIVKAYFENDAKIFEKLFDPFGQNSSQNVQNSTMAGNISEYLKSIDFVMTTNYWDFEKGNALYANDFFNINLQNLKLFQAKVVKELLDNAESFGNGMDVKNSILNSFKMYASNVFMGSAIPNARFFYDFWNIYFDTVVNTIESVKGVFECQGVVIPSTNDPEMLDMIFDAQCLCFKNYFNVSNIAGEIKVADMQDFPIHKYLPSDLNVQNKYMKQLKEVIFSDLTEEYFDEQQYFGSTCYDDAEAVLRGLDSPQKKTQRQKNTSKNLQPVLWICK